MDVSNPEMLCDIVRTSPPSRAGYILKGCEDSMKINESFNEMAKLYDEVRPSYPKDLIEDIILRTHITPKDKLLEIGAGTGKATLQFLRRDFQVHCIEPGQNLVDILKTKCLNDPNITIDVDSFENWEAKSNQVYDLIFSASAFHWIRPEIRYEKTHKLLKEGGYLAIFGYQADKTIDVAKKIDTLITSFVPDFFENPVFSIEKFESELNSTPYFNQLEVLEYPVESNIEIEKYIQSINSNAKFAALERDIKANINLEMKKVLSQNGNFVYNRLIYYLFLAKKAKMKLLG